MSELRELYQELIIDHGRKPRNFGELATANHIKQGFNPLCGDKLTLYVHTQDDHIDKVQFTGSGCAISVASASLMTEVLQGKTLAEVHTLFNEFHNVVTGHADADSLDHVAKLKALAGVSEFPARVKCASLCWHTLIAAIDASDDKPISTE